MSGPKRLAFHHQPARAQSWASVDDDLARYIGKAVDEVAAQLAESSFVGAYLHGSLAMGSFYRPKSDVDLLFVVEARMSGTRRESVSRLLCDLSDERPIVGDLEVSVVCVAQTRHFRHPLPFEVHYSSAWKQRIRDDRVDYVVNRSDPDLACHCHAVLRRGVVLRGAPIAETLGPVPDQALQASIRGDIAWILADDHLAETPVYGILNCCRVLALETEGWNRVWSKDEGGEWAIAHLPPAYRPLIAQALACYRSVEAVSSEARKTDGHAWDAAALAALRDYVRAQLG